MDLTKSILGAFYPNTCAGCGTVISEAEFLCEYCMSMIERTDLSKFCLKCGNNKKSCSCNKYVLHYNGCAAPFYNDGIAKRIVYSYKFRRNEGNSEFIARQMALCVKQSFYDVKLDVVCCVPIELYKGLKRGYNQSALLAKRISELLGIPFYEGVLGCYSKKYLQHETSGKERYQNVKNAFYVKTPIKNKNVLLVDDIKTTGATLSECAKQLLEAGSDKIYCITALVTDNKEKKNGN